MHEVKVGKETAAAAHRIGTGKQSVSSFQSLVKRWLNHPWSEPSAAGTEPRYDGGWRARERIGVRGACREVHHPGCPGGAIALIHGHG